MTYVLAYVLTILAANYSLDRWGLVDIGPWLLPAGTAFAGFAFVIRDGLHETKGRAWVFAAIAAGALLSWWTAPGFALASGVAFGLSELADWSVYEPLRRRRRVTAVVVSQAVGSVADSLLFLWLAFDSINGWATLAVGKWLVVLPFAAAMVVWRLRDRLPERRGALRSAA
jgi:uncharacterized PurR-regulated membrane protein YhhQ (DUF165 family)